jgi:hypothetical protein
MKRALSLIAVVMFAALPAFATYVVVLKDGTRYAAKAKWTLVKGKAIVQLENGQSLQLDPSLIDVPRSEQATKMGLTNASVIDLDPKLPGGQSGSQKASLGSQIKLRPRSEVKEETAPAAPSSPTPVPLTPGQLSVEVIDKFDRAFENVGIFEKKLVSTGGRSLRADLTVDTEEKVFNAISAASFLMVRNAGVRGTQIELVELYMRMTNGGSAGRFQMTRDEAVALDNHSMSQQEYFVRKVIY